MYNMYIKRIIIIIEKTLFNSFVVTLIMRHENIISRISYCPSLSFCENTKTSCYHFGEIVNIRYIILSCHTLSLFTFV